MDTNFQIQEIKSQINNMKSQIENIEFQNNNSSMMKMLNPISDQILNLSIQMLNTGIKAFQIGCNLSMNINKYCNALQIISEQITDILFSKQMMQLPMNIMQNQQLIEPKKPILNIIIEDTKGRKIGMNVENDTSIRVLCDRYFERIGYQNDIKYLVIDTFKLHKNDQRKINEFSKQTLLKIKIFID